MKDRFQEASNRTSTEGQLKENNGSRQELPRWLVKQCQHFDASSFEVKKGIPAQSWRPAGIVAVAQIAALCRCKTFYLDILIAAI